MMSRDEYRTFAAALRRWLLTVGITLCVTASVPAQAPEDDAPPPAPAEAPAATTPAAEVPPGLASPRKMLETFITAMNEYDWETAISCLDLSLVQKEAAADRASQVLKCLNRIELVDFESDGSIPDSTTMGDLAEWTFFPRDGVWDWQKQRRFRAIEAALDEADVIDKRIRLVATPTGWKFSKHTVQNAGAILTALRDAGYESVVGDEPILFWERIESYFPASLVEHEFLRVKYWQWITLFAAILAGMILDFTVRFILRVITAGWIRRRGGHATQKSLRRTMRPFGLAAAALLWLFVMPHLGLPDEALMILVPAVKIFAMLAVVWSAFRVTDLLGEVAASKATKTYSKFDDLLIPLVGKTIKVFIAIFGVIYIANSQEIPIAPLLTGLGIGGAGFAFAAKDTLEHLFGSVTVIADRPFEVGDWIQVGDVEGTVEELGFRSTRVRTFYNSLVTVPNGNLVRAVVDNYGKRKYRRWTTHLNVTYDTPPEKIDAFCEGLREIIRMHPYTRKDYYQVWLHQFGAHSLDVLVYLFFETPDWNTELRERHRFMLDTIRLAERLGVAFAYPTQTLNIVQGDGAAPSLEAPQRDTEHRAHALGRRAVHEITADANWRGSVPPPHVVPSAPRLKEDETQIETTVEGSA